MVEYRKQYLFSEAIELVLEGKKITRLAWNNEKIFGELKDSRLVIFKDKKYYDWILVEGDLISEDWVEVKSDKK